MRGLKINLTALLLALACVAGGCKQVRESAGLSVMPKTLRDVPAERLAFRFEPDVSEETLPERLRKDEAEEPQPAIKTAFETQRTGDALIRTVLDPLGQRALALYGTTDTDTDFRIDLYSSEGQFIRNILPTGLTGVFRDEVAWSPDGQSIVFSGIRNPALKPTPTQEEPDAPPDLSTQAPLPGASPVPAPSVAPIIASVQTFRTEQIYVGDRDGFNLRPLTSREGLIYFKLAWSPDGRAVSALACKEDEYDARFKKGLLPAGRPRVITLEGEERLLDDRLTDVAPVWSPDGSKIATAFEYDVAVYDAAGGQPTGGGLALREPLRAASIEYDARVFKKADNQGAVAQANAPQSNKQASKAQPQAATPDAAQASSEPVLISLNPFVRLDWAEPETIYAQTAFVRFYGNDPTFKYMRWHVVHIHPQSAVLSQRAPRARPRVT